MVTETHICSSIHHFFLPSLLTNETTPQPSCRFVFGCGSSQVHKHTNSCFCFVFEYSKGRRPCFHSSTSSMTRDTSLKRCNVFTPVMICASYRFPDSHTKSLFGPLVVTRLHNVTGKNTRIS